LIYNDVKIPSFCVKFIVKEAFKYLDSALKNKGGEGLKFTSNSETFFRYTKNHEVIYFAGMTIYNWLYSLPRQDFGFFKLLEP